MQKALILTTLLVGALGALPTTEKVASLPQIGNITGFEMYSGYVKTSKASHHLHYALVTSQNDW